jgi:hypothetical protein
MNTVLWLGLTLVVAGLWSGLLLTLTTILHPMYAADDGPAFAQDLGRFLPVARKSPTNYLLVIGLVVAPAGTLAALWGERGEAPFVLTAVGLALTIAGPLLASRLLAEPNYDVILGWDPSHVPADWLVARRRYFALNWLRAGITWAAFGCFLAAAYLHVT